MPILARIHNTCVPDHTRWALDLLPKRKIAVYRNTTRAGQRVCLWQADNASDTFRWNSTGCAPLKRRCRFFWILPLSMRCPGKKKIILIRILDFNFRLWCYLWNIHQRHRAFLLNRPYIRHLVWKRFCWRLLESACTVSRPGDPMWCNVESKSPRSLNRTPACRLKSTPPHEDSFLNK